MLLSDSFLNIKTGGIRNLDLPHNTLFYRTESSEYEALKVLFQNYQPLSNPFWLDVGCGEGRVLFSAHFIYRCPVVGVELNSSTFQHLYHNMLNYLKKHPSEKNIYLENTYIHDYSFDRRINTVYLFNPFAPEIFQQFIYQLLESYDQYPREIDIILYYPHAENIGILEEAGLFTHKQSIPFDLYHDKRLRFEIYSLKTY